MKSSSLTTASLSQHETKIKSRGRSQQIPGILVNQRLGKIKLEDDIPAPIKMETDFDSNASKANSEAHDVETFTQEFVVTKEDVSSPQSSEEPGQGQEDQSSSCTCQEEISSLKDAVKQLSLQVKKQNQVIIEIKSGLRNAVLSLMSCCQDEKEDGSHQDSCHVVDEVQESPVIVNVSSKTCGPILKDPLLFENSDNCSGAFEEATHVAQIIQVSCSPSSSASASKSSCLNESGMRSCQNTEDVDMEDDEDSNVHDDDSSYVPDNSEDETDKELGDEHDRQGNQLKTTKIPTANSEGRFECSKCGKDYKLERYLREHKRDAHSGKRPQFKCHLCHKVVNTRKGLSKHISSIHEGIRYKCTHCPGTFSDRSRLLQHERSVHKEGGPPTQRCKICGIHLAKSKNSIQLHMRQKHHSSERTNPSAKYLPKKRKPKPISTIPFQCQLCSSSFLELKDLHFHLSQRHGTTAVEAETETEK